MEGRTQLVLSVTYDEPKGINPMYDEIRWQTLNDKDFYTQLAQPDLLEEGDQIEWNNGAFTAISEGSNFIGHPVSSLPMIAGGLFPSHKARAFRPVKVLA